MRSSDGRYREHGANQCPARASHVHLPEEIRSNLSLLSRHAQPYLLVCALPSGSKGIGRYTPETRAVLQCDEADRRVKNRTIAVMERRAQPGFAALQPEGSASTDTVICAKVRIRRWRMEVVERMRVCCLLSTSSMAVSAAAVSLAGLPAVAHDRDGQLDFDRDRQVLGGEPGRQRDTDNALGARRRSGSAARIVSR
jgi:hypothetical protein